MAVIAVLAAVLFPVFTAAMKAASRSQCQSNLSQIAKAFEAYTSDYGGCYPNTDSQYLWSGYYWREPMRGYVGASRADTRKMILACPADPTPTGIYSGTSYAYSASFYMTPEQVNAVVDPNFLRTKFAATNPKLTCASMKTSAVKFATKKALVAEYWTLHSDDIKVGWYDDPAETGNDPWSGARNYLFADGHVRYFPTGKIHPATSPIVARTRSLPDINLTTDGIAGKDID